MKKYLIILINLLIIIPLLLAINLFIPFLHKFKKKFVISNLNKINVEDKEVLIKLPKYYFSKHNIDEYHKENFLNTLNKLIEKEKVYIKNTNTNEISYQNISYIFNIIDSAEEAITELDRVSKNERKIAYYEKGRNTNLDKLVEEYTKILEEQGYKKLSLLASKREVKLKRLLAKLKRDKSLFFNFYLLFFILNPIKDFKIKKEERDLFELAENIFNFYRVGHATNPQIYKSIAIQIYEIYKNEFEESELQDIISVLITSYFDLDKTYTNFNDIGKQKVYIKNIVYNFPLFECSTKDSNEQNEKVIRFFSYSNRIFPKFFPKFLKKKILHYYLDDVVDFYYKMDSLNFFGFVPRKK